MADKTTNDCPTNQCSGRFRCAKTPLVFVFGVNDMKELSFGIIALVAVCCVLVFVVGCKHERPSAAAVQVAHDNGVLKASIGIESLGGLFEPILQEGEALPIERSEDYSTVVDNQAAVDVRILQGYSPLSKNNVELATFRLTDLPALPRGVPQIRVTFRVDEHGLLAVDAEELFRGKKPKVVLLSRNELSAQQLATLKEKAEAAKESDEKEAGMIRARNEADLALYMGRKFLRLYRSSLSEETVVRISRQIEAVERAKAYAPREEIEAAAQALRATVEGLSDLNAM